jgi:hypothetical protein
MPIPAQRYADSAFADLRPGDTVPLLATNADPAVVTVFSRHAPAGASWGNSAFCPHAHALNVCELVSDAREPVSAFCAGNENRRSPTLANRSLLSAPGNGFQEAETVAAGHTSRFASGAHSPNDRVQAAV